MTTSQILSRLARLGYAFDSEMSSTNNFVFWYTMDGYSSNRISFSSLRSALRFAERN
jgi:hypothetical protein